MEGQRLGNILLREGLIDEKTLDFCLSLQNHGVRQRLGKLLTDYDFINEEQMISALARQAGWGVYKGNFEAHKGMVTSLGKDFIVKHKVFPAKTDDGIVFVMAYSDNLGAIDVIQDKLNTKACFMLAAEEPLCRAIDKVSADENSVSCRGGVNEDNVLSWFEHCMQDALKRGATDIHIEASAKALEVRLRIDGILHAYGVLRSDLQRRLVNIVFHRADVTISDFSSLHDARFTYQNRGENIDVRVSHIPCVNGSSLVLRLLDRNKSSIDLISLGYPNYLWKRIKSMLSKPEGMALIVGPTGCGKTTTLYAMLNYIKSIERKIVTIEDPVEMHHTLMTQVQTNDKRLITFSNAVRAFLRHDPNIMLIGEIRDDLTAQEAIRAAMTGHKVFATLHANQVFDAVLRLHDLGIPYAYMASTLSMIISQRLVRLLCPLCKQRLHCQDVVWTSSEFKFVEELEDVSVAGGCSGCNDGYKGRTVVASVLECGDPVDSMLLEGDIRGIKIHVRENGIEGAMFEQLKMMVKQGAISPQEAVRVLG